MTVGELKKLLKKEDDKQNVFVSSDEEFNTVFRNIEVSKDTDFNAIIFFGLSGSEIDEV